MSTLLVTTVSTSNGTVDLILQTGNNTAGKISIPASGADINVSANVIVNGTMNVYSSATVNGSVNVTGSISANGITANGNLTGNVIFSSRQDGTSEGGQISLRRASDNADMYGIDVNGSTSTPDVRIFNNQSSSELLKINSTGNVTVVGNNLTLGTSSISTSGYSRLPNGLLLQWGTVFVNQDSSASVTFPVAFAALYNISITAQSSLSTAGAGLDGVSSQSTTGFTLNHGQDGNITFYWLAIGR